MGEYLKVNGQSVKLGTCENLYYTRFDALRNAVEEGVCEYVPGNCLPREYLDEQLGWRYRFPFPDEDNILIGAYRDYERGVALKLTCPEFLFTMGTHKIVRDYREHGGYNCAIAFPCPFSEEGRKAGVTASPVLEIVYQKQIHGRLWGVFRCPYCQELWRFTPEEVATLVGLTDPAGLADPAQNEKMLYRLVAGYTNPCVCA